MVDTGGIGLDTGDGDLMEDVRMQAEEAIREADVIVFVLDALVGITAADEELAGFLRRTNKPLLLAANKAENPKRQMDATEFYKLGLGEPIAISALHGEGTGDLLDEVVEWFPKGTQVEDEEEVAVSIAIVGRPNVGKSSLVNALVGDERSIVRDEAGTTRDAIDSIITYHGQKIRLIDTAGIRRRGKVGVGVEKFSVLRAVRAIDRADVAVLMIDGDEGVRAQDTHVASFIDESAKGMIICDQQVGPRGEEPAHPGAVHGSGAGGSEVRGLVAHRLRLGEDSPAHRSDHPGGPEGEGAADARDSHVEAQRGAARRHRRAPADRARSDAEDVLRDADRH